MIVLDTNVVSELMRDAPAPPVLQWLDEQSEDELFLTAVTQAEILHGINRLPRGKRRDGLATAAGAIFDEDFVGRVLAFDSEAAVEYAEILVARRTSGRPIAVLDGQIASIARSRGATLATRDTRDFEGCGVRLLNPWRER